MTYTNGRLDRLRRRIIVLTMFVVFVAFAVPILSLFFAQQQSADTVETITCVSARANVAQLEALASLQRRLGIPIDYQIPEVPPECDS